MLALLAALPSPPDNSISIGPLELRAYGLFIAIGAIVAVGIARRRWASLTGDDTDAIGDVAVWAIPAGFVGARLYHVVTDWHRFDDAPEDIVKVWEGGLGIPGAILLGAIVGVAVARRKGYDVPTLMDAVAPALPVAQAIGRLGNWFNQELFGRPTDLPWGLEIDPDRRPDGYEAVETFHPTFLYEALWNLVLAAILVVLGRRKVLRPGQLFVLYVGGYALGRLWVEALRIDTATRIAGVRVNIWVSGLTIVAAALWFLWWQRRPADAEAGESQDTETGASKNPR
ncbi:prolipoprotein diacylglyceryl transferase [Acidimicrobiia bacterium EGI L10123]|uniref:prolipoprotein diacylglyceryl transferase n=1 Tax=Salinilacustrithrix flava TaxID=2957203 RepID=UPI003D7C358C|nr:prolipoprotein diacylglyceryl transferase [Acidimicrobiia bacterium EGI L10123]